MSNLIELLKNTKKQIRYRALGGIVKRKQAAFTVARFMKVMNLQ